MNPENIAFFDPRKFEKIYYQKCETMKFDFIDCKLDMKTVNLCQGYRAVSCFVNDHLDEDCLRQMSSYGVEIVVLRCAGYNNVDIKVASQLGIKVCRVPSYSPESVAEFALLQMLCLSRKIHRAYLRTKEMNFSLEGLVGSSLSGKTIGIVGTGQIGTSLVKILSGFGAKILAFDKEPSDELKNNFGVNYVEFDSLLSQSDIISLHVPLIKETQHLLATPQFNKMKENVFIINTGRGALIDSRALIGALKSKKVAGAAIDVYEEEENYFFQDFSDSGIDDDILARLVTFPNVLVTAHQGFLTDKALQEIAGTTLESLREWQEGKPLTNEIKIN